jgi:hypothetical protein
MSKKFGCVTLQKPSLQGLILIGGIFAIGGLGILALVLSALTMNAVSLWDCLDKLAVKVMEGQNAQ